MNTSNMRNIRKSAGDLGPGMFRQMLEYKAEGRVVKVDPKNTTQNCSQCGERVPKGIRDRTHDCPNCGLVLDRDVNAVREILKRATS